MRSPPPERKQTRKPERGLAAGAVGSPASPWDAVYGRQLSATELAEISENLRAFFGVLADWSSTEATRRRRGEDRDPVARQPEICG